MVPVDKTEVKVRRKMVKIVNRCTLEEMMKLDMRN